MNLQEDATYEERPREILDKKEQVLQTKIIPLGKVLWDHHRVEGEDEKQVPITLYRFASLNFEGKGGEDVIPSTNELNKQ